MNPTATMSEQTSPRRRVRERSKAAFRNAILAAAETVFAREGFSAAKMADIAAEAGVAAGTLYNYFGSKDEIFKSILSSGVAEMGSRVERAAQVEDPLDRMREVMRVSLEFLDEKGTLFLVYVQLHGGPDMETYTSGLEHAEMRRAHLELLAAAAAEARDQGRLRDDIDPETQVLALSGITNGFILRWAEEGCAPDELTTQLDTIFDLFLKGSGPQ